MEAFTVKSSRVVRGQLQYKSNGLPLRPPTVIAPFFFLTNKNKSMEGKEIEPEKYTQPIINRHKKINEIWAQAISIFDETGSGNKTK